MFCLKQQAILYLQILLFYSAGYKSKLELIIFILSREGFSLASDIFCSALHFTGEHFFSQLLFRMEIFQIVGSI